MVSSSIAESSAALDEAGRIAELVLAVEADLEPALCGPRVEQMPAQQFCGRRRVIWSSAVLIIGTSVSVRFAPSAAPADSLLSAAATSPSPCAITLRMTFGSASPASVAIGTQRMPSGARVRAGTLAV